jgi:hypothetical protein
MKSIFFILTLVAFIGCAQLIMEPADFAWPIETVLDTDDEGVIQESRYSFSANVKELFIMETADSAAYLNQAVRIIRDTEGYYYFIAPGFKNVYICSAKDGQFILQNQVFVSEFGLDLPAFNQRKPYIELLEGEEHLVYLNSQGIKENNGENE